MSTPHLTTMFGFLATTSKSFQDEIVSYDAGDSSVTDYYYKQGKKLQTQKQSLHTHTPQRLENQKDKKIVFASPTLYTSYFRPRAPCVGRSSISDELSE